MKKRMWLLAATIFMAGILIGCSSQSGGSNNNGEGASASGGAPSEITFGAATQGGFWYTLSGAMSDKMNNLFPDSSTTIVEGGSISNLLGLGQDKFHIAFSNGQTVPEALNGEKAFEEPITNVSTVATLYPNVFHIAVRADSDIHSVEDLAGKTVSPGIKGYSGELAFQEILKLNDMSYDDLEGIEYVGTSDGADLLRDGHIDAITGMLSAPVAVYQELDTTLGLRFIPLKKETVEALHAQNEGYLKHTIPAGTYPNQSEDVLTTAGYTVLLANNNLMNEDTVYELTKMIIEERDSWEDISKVMSDFNAEYSVKNSVGELHPGAEKYYKEIGALE
ncbi:TAXI family TRAP transporter solute-binding subunit [Virgibacillus sp. MSP4-1]|uniref:TAXI family TRAP transporter solute-binding subunit n=1 Tax=Virgibacillus sp. MSP4-1 TaxID=2700081 RepID=UPI0003AB1FAD|nr:TAXI family TRAP transporter solute-binding subunit [Virgibacillus sp. MSP4-1]QHS23369.1 TAXI family TRAP transporter solute-binding subunit [Virgibacillus sp. MSP4-1]